MQNPLDTRDIENKEITSKIEAIATVYGMALYILEQRKVLTTEQVDAISGLTDEFLRAMIDGKFIELDGPDFKIHTREEAAKILKKPTDTLEIGG